jgi:hypothetical protein
MEGAKRWFRVWVSALPHFARAESPAHTTEYKQMFQTLCDCNTCRPFRFVLGLGAPCVSPEVSSPCCRSQTSIYKSWPKSVESTVSLAPSRDPPALSVLRCPPRLQTPSSPSQSQPQPETATQLFKRSTDASTQVSMKIASLPYSNSAEPCVESFPPCVHSH